MAQTTKAPAQTIVLKGARGTQYTYWLYPIGAPFDAQPGNYFFARLNPDGRYTVLYIGETGDLSERFDNHHKMPCVKANGGTHIAAHKSAANQQVRRTEEQDLIAAYHPVCNG